jgi:hypothetical protein
MIKKIFYLVIFNLIIILVASLSQAHEQEVCRNDSGETYFTNVEYYNISYELPPSLCTEIVTPCCFIESDESNVSKEKEKTLKLFNMRCVSPRNLFAKDTITIIINEYNDPIEETDYGLKKGLIDYLLYELRYNSKGNGEVLNYSIGNCSGKIIYGYINSGSGVEECAVAQYNLPFDLKPKGKAKCTIVSKLPESESKDLLRNFTVSYEHV